MKNLKMSWLKFFSHDYKKLTSTEKKEKLKFALRENGVGDVKPYSIL